jgi:hypothetical protein
MADVGIIYKLILGDKYYYGSTTNSLQKRLNHHKSDCNKKSSLLFDTGKEIGIDNIKIECVETIQYNNKKELLLKERYYIENNINDSNCLNINLPYNSPEEKLLRMKNYNKQRRIQYKINNPKPERILKKNDPDYNKKRWLEWAEKNREHLRERYKIQDAKKSYD